jgi:hypothetical protein
LIGRTRLLTAAAVLAVGGSLALYAVLSGVDDHEKATVDKDAKHLVAALVRRDAALAPESDEDWVPGVWAVFRRVDSASLVRVGKRPQNGPNFGSSGSDWVADVLLHTGRGLVLLEMSFSSGPKPDLLYELRPERIPDGLLDARTLARLRSAQLERGPKIADDLVITIAGRTGGDPAEPRPGNGLTLSPLAQCVIAADQDVKKIQECVRRSGSG